MFFGKSKTKILVADDDIISREMLLEVLSDDYEVLEACNGQEAVEKALVEKPALILMDFDMPVMNGLRAVNALRADERTKAVPVVMCTGRGELENVEALLEAGADDYVIKPVDPSKLLLKVRAILGGRRR